MLIQSNLFTTPNLLGRRAAFHLISWYECFRPSLFPCRGKLLELVVAQTEWVGMKNSSLPAAVKTDGSCKVAVPFACGPAKPALLPSSSAWCHSTALPTSSCGMHRAACSSQRSASSCALQFALSARSSFGPMVYFEMKGL